MKRRVLIIDDDAGVRLTVHHILTTAGYEVCSIQDGKLALDAFRNFEPEVVVTDLVMPGLDGTDIIALLKEERSATKIVAMSGGARLGLANILQLARDAGADAILPKPFTVDQLKAILADVAGPSPAHAKTSMAALK